MIVCDDFVFLHLHKSGGTFVNQMMLKCMPTARRIGYHLPYAELPAEFRHLPVLGSVRNPWDYYVSWYHFQHGQARPNPLFLMASENRALDFSGTIRNLLDLHENDSRINALVDAFPDHFVGHGLNLTKACIAGIRGSGLGFYSFLHQRMYRGAEVHMLRMESLRDDLRRYLTERDLSSDLLHYFLDAAPRLNTSEHGPCRDYYNDDLHNAVGKAEANLIEKYDYRF